MDIDPMPNTGVCQREGCGASLAGKRQGTKYCSKKCCNRKWIANNPEKHRESSRKWQAKNPEKHRETNRKWRASNPEKHRESSHKWRINNPEKIRKQNREGIRRWRANNPEKAREQDRKRHHRRRARKQAASVHPFPADWREAQLKRQGGLCAYCRQSCEEYDLEHVVALSQDGIHAPSNAVLACRSCNNSKYNSDLGEWLDRKGFRAGYESWAFDSRLEDKVQLTLF